MNANDDLEKRRPSTASEATPNLEPEAQEITMGSLETRVCKPVRLKMSLESGSPTERIGNYKLLQLIGEGGTGEVWMADQTEPVKRRVALKLIKTGTDSKPPSSLASKPSAKPSR